MGKICWLILHSGSHEAVAQATAWAQKGLDVVVATRQSHPNKEYYECELAYVSMLFNVAMVRRVSCTFNCFFLTFNV